MSNDANSILMGRGSSAKFEQIGATVSGTVMSEPTAEQQKEYRTNVLEFWPDGSPKMQVIVQIQTNERDPQQLNDSGLRTLYIKGKELTAAVRQAVRQAGANGIHTGGTLTVTYIGDGKAEGGLNPPKMYAAQYQSPAVSFNGVAAPATAPVSPAPVAPVQQPVYAPAPAAPQAYAPPVQQQVAASVLGAPAVQMPANVDPNVWARLSPAQQQAVAAASAAQAQPAY